MNPDSTWDVNDEAFVRLNAKITALESERDALKADQDHKAAVLKRIDELVSAAYGPGDIIASVRRSVNETKSAYAERDALKDQIEVLRMAQVADETDLDSLRAKVAAMEEAGDALVWRLLDRAMPVSDEIAAWKAASGEGQA